MNLFYSMGDPKVFLNLQVFCRNADALGGSIGGVLGNYLYTVNPVAPFIFTCALACDLADDDFWPQVNLMGWKNSCNIL